MSVQPTSAGGLLRLQPSHKFRVAPIIGGGFDPSVADHFMTSVESVELDLVGNKLTIVVRQSVVPDGFRAVQAVLAGSVPTIEMLDDSYERPVISLIFDGEAIDHQMKLDYANTGWVKHTIVWKLDRVRAF